jgi:hypothetical protein
MEKDEFARSNEKEMRIGYCCDRNSESRKERLSVIDCRRFVFWDNHRTETTLWWVQMINGNYKPKQNPAKIFQKYFFALFIPIGNWQHLE